MNLSRQMISRIGSKDIDLPPSACFDLPEKVIQFGTGVLLRALPDYFIDKANKKGFFNGRIVLVKSTDKGETAAFEQQDGLYTICVKGLIDGEKYEENILNASVSRVLSAKNDWKEILTCAANPELNLVISNTTEIGIQLTQDDIHGQPPQSFPGKLLSFLYHRFQLFKGDPQKGLVIIPTELLPSNGELLRDILLELTKQNSLEKEFRQWLTTANHFCNSLVDRIVPGKLTPLQQLETENILGYTDELMIMAEPYRLWAIESPDKKVHELLSFSQADPGVVIVPDITIFRELKLRLLNGSHTLSCGLAHLAGLKTVKEAMENLPFSTFIQTLLFKEIIPAITSAGLSTEAATQFANQVLDRYRNPFIEHLWLSITLQYGSKMQMRDVPILIKYFERFKINPECISLGFAAHFLFMKSIKGEDGHYYGEAQGKPYLVNDDRADYYSRQWEQPEGIVNRLLGHSEFWGRDLSQLPGFPESVLKHLQGLMREGAMDWLEKLHSIKNSDEEDNSKSTS